MTHIIYLAIIFFLLVTVVALFIDYQKKFIKEQPLRKWIDELQEENKILRLQNKEYYDLVKKAAAALTDHNDRNERLEQFGDKLREVEDQIEALQKLESQNLPPILPSDN